jgi:hypothetical protein
MPDMTFTSQCCNAPIHTAPGTPPVMHCASCKREVDIHGAPVSSGLFDHIWDGMQGMSDDELQQCVETGHFYTPYIPLQVTKVKLK